MDSSYVRALETRVRWIRWLSEKGYASATRSHQRTKILPVYDQALRKGDTFFMNAKFGRLVDHARQTIPDDLQWDNTWMQAKRGWMYMEEPFECPPFALNKDMQAYVRREGSAVAHVPVMLRAVAWMPVGGIQQLPDGRYWGEYGKEDPDSPTTAFLTFFELDEGFESWSYFIFRTGDKVIERVHSFEEGAEKEGGDYEKGRITDMKHEIRWVFTAMHLMGQRLTMVVQHDADRSTRRRLATTVVPSFFKVVTLRKMEADRKESDDPKTVDWQWQWTVSGHWRNQYFPSTKEHKHVFIEAYIKGPDDKPLKPISHKIFTAIR